MKQALIISQAKSFLKKIMTEQKTDILYNLGAEHLILIKSGKIVESPISLLKPLDRFSIKSSGIDIDNIIKNGLLTFSKNYNGCAKEFIIKLQDNDVVLYEGFSKISAESILKFL